MTSANDHQNDTSAPPNVNVDEDTIARSEDPKRFARRNLHTTLFDAVALRLTASSFAQKRVQKLGLVTQSGRIDLSQVAQPETWFKKPLSPAEALFRRENAPERYAEHDLYDQARYLYDASTRTDGKEEESKLPDGDLCAAIHTFASDFYACLENSNLGEEQRLARRKNEIQPSLDFSSLDETALLALGMLVEEWIEDWLSQGGDRDHVQSESNPNGAETQQDHRLKCQGITVPPVKGSGDIAFTEGLYDRARSPSSGRWVDIESKDESELRVVDDKVTTNWKGRVAIKRIQKRYAIGQTGRTRVRGDPDFDFLNFRRGPRKTGPARKRSAQATVTVEERDADTDADIEMSADAEVDEDVGMDMDLENELNTVSRAMAREAASSSRLRSHERQQAPSDGDNGDAPMGEGAAALGTTGTQQQQGLGQGQDQGRQRVKKNKKKKQKKQEQE